MKKVIAAVFLAIVVICCATSAWNALRADDVMRIIPDTFGNYGGGLRGFVLTVTDAAVWKSTENAVTERVSLHDRWIDLFGAAQRAAGVDVITEPTPDTEVYRLQSGSIAFRHIRRASFSKAELEGIRAVKRAADEVGAESFHFLIARDICPDDPDFTARGVSDPSAAQNAYYAETMRKIGFQSVDLHRAMHEAGMKHADMYYRTDHHWTVHAGFWAAGQVAEALGLPTDLLSSELYETERHEQIFLGSEGKHCGSLYCGRDDFEILLPTFQTDMTLDIAMADKEHVQRAGDFDRALLFREHLTTNTYLDTPYRTFLSGDCPRMTIENRLCPEGAYVLFCNDSYTRSLAPYLALVCRRVDMIDPRYYTDSVADYIRENRPDYVCVTATAHMGEQYYIQTGAK